SSPIRTARRRLWTAAILSLALCGFFLTCGTSEKLLRLLLTEPAGRLLGFVALVAATTASTLGFAIPAATSTASLAFLLPECQFVVPLGVFVARAGEQYAAVRFQCGIQRLGGLIALCRQAALQLSQTKIEERTVTHLALSGPGNSFQTVHRVLKRVCGQQSRGVVVQHFRALVPIVYGPPVQLRGICITTLAERGERIVHRVRVQRHGQKRLHHEQNDQQRRRGAAQRLEAHPMLRTADFASPSAVGHPRVQCHQKECWKEKELKTRLSGSAGVQRTRLGAEVSQCGPNASCLVGFRGCNKGSASSLGGDLQGAGRIPGYDDLATLVPLEKLPPVDLFGYGSATLRAESDRDQRDPGFRSSGCRLTNLLLAVKALAVAHYYDRPVRARFRCAEKVRGLSDRSGHRASCLTNNARVQVFQEEVYRAFIYG